MHTAQPNPFPHVCCTRPPCPNMGAVPAGRGGRAQPQQRLEPHWPTRNVRACLLVPQHASSTACQSWAGTARTTGQGVSTRCLHVEVQRQRRRVCAQVRLVPAVLLLQNHPKRCRVWLHLWAVGAATVGSGAPRQAAEMRWQRELSGRPHGCNCLDWHNNMQRRDASGMQEAPALRTAHCVGTQVRTGKRRT